MVAISLSLAALVDDLGRPARFVNMLRVAKPTSLMSVGTWILTAYGPLAGLAGAAELRAMFPRTCTGSQRCSRSAPAPPTSPPAPPRPRSRLHRRTHPTQPHLPGMRATRNSVRLHRLSCRSVRRPCHDRLDTRRRRPGAATGARRGPPGTRRTRRDVIDGSCGRNIAGRAARQAQPGVENAHRDRRAAHRDRGRSPPAGRRDRGAALLAGSAGTRFAIFEAGQASARDPRYTVIPQRERADRRAQATASRVPPSS